MPDQEWARFNPHATIGIGEKDAPLGEIRIPRAAPTAREWASHKLRLETHEYEIVYGT
jgi:hypothetical protein